MKLLLISNSTNAGEEYLRYPMPEIGRFLQGVSEIVFVPYAAVTFSYAEYEKKVQARLSELGIRVRSVHRAKDPARMVREAEALCVGGGNTFALAKKMQEQGLMAARMVGDFILATEQEYGGKHVSTYNRGTFHFFSFHIRTFLNELYLAVQNL